MVMTNSQVGIYILIITEEVLQNSIVPQMQMYNCILQKLHRYCVVF